jgi:hypothetical protein
MNAAAESPGGKCFLVAETPEAKEALGSGEIEIRTFPFRVGRESRKITWTPQGIVSERRESNQKPNNDLYLIEKSDPMNVSREHFQIEQDGESFALVDRQSTCGTLVAGRHTGGRNSGGRTALRNGDVIIVGASVSPFVFKFEIR